MIVFYFQGAPKKSRPVATKKASMIMNISDKVITTKQTSSKSNVINENPSKKVCKPPRPNMFLSQSCSVFLGMFSGMFLSMFLGTFSTFLSTFPGTFLSTFLSNLGMFLGPDLTPREHENDLRQLAELEDEETTSPYARSRSTPPRGGRGGPAPAPPRSTSPARTSESELTVAGMNLEANPDDLTAPIAVEAKGGCPNVPEPLSSLPLVSSMLETASRSLVMFRRLNTHMLRMWLPMCIPRFSVTSSACSSRPVRFTTKVIKPFSSLLSCSVATNIVKVEGLINLRLTHVLTIIRISQAFYQKMTPRYTTVRNAKTPHTTSPRLQKRHMMCVQPPTQLPRRIGNVFNEIITYLPN